MKDRLILRLQLLMFLLSFLWMLLGAPITAAEWQDVPHRLWLMFTLLPGRMHSVFTRWR